MFLVRTGKYRFDQTGWMLILISVFPGAFHHVHGGFVIQFIQFTSVTWLQWYVTVTISRLTVFLSDLKLC